MITYVCRQVFDRVAQSGPRHGGGVGPVERHEGLDLASHVINIPAQPGQYIKLDDSGSEFRVTLTRMTTTKNPMRKIVRTALVRLVPESVIRKSVRTKDPHRSLRQHAGPRR